MTSAMEPKIQLFDFTENFSDTTVHFKLMVLDSSFFVWIGTDPKLANIAVSMPPKYVSQFPKTDIM